MAASSLRVMAIAYGETPEKLVFLGLVGLRDPPRRGVREAVQVCKESHVRVVMITGDSKETAIAVARELGIAESEEEALSALELDQFAHDIDAAERIRRTNVFYRMTPAHKVKVVNAFSQDGKSIVAMTGDGVNDAPALSQSDIGIAMGTGGSDVCKEASEIILVDNNFTTIVAAIEEGKVIFENIKNFLHFQLTTSVAAMLLTAACSIADLPLPLNATQILLINIIMDGPPAQSLTFESYRDKKHGQPPRDPKAPIVDHRMAAKICLSAVIMVAGTISMFLLSIPKDQLAFGALTEMNEAPRVASTMAFTTFVLFQLFNAMNCRSISKSVFTVGLTSNRGFLLSALGTIIAQLAVIYFAPLGRIFRTAPISPSGLFACLLVASSVWIVDEIWKLYMRYK
jgi:Ca2+-transporting ATPase